MSFLRSWSRVAVIVLLVFGCLVVGFSVWQRQSIAAYLEYRHELAAGRFFNASQRMDDLPSWLFTDEERDDLHGRAFDELATLANTYDCGKGKIVPGTFENQLRDMLAALPEAEQTEYRAGLLLVVILRCGTQPTTHAEHLAAMRALTPPSLQRFAVHSAAQSNWVYYYLYCGPGVQQCYPDGEGSRSYTRREVWQMYHDFQPFEQAWPNRKAFIDDLVEYDPWAAIDAARELSLDESVSTDIARQLADFCDCRTETFDALERLGLQGAVEDELRSCTQGWEWRVGSGSDKP